LEAVRPSAAIADQRIKVEVDLDGDGTQWGWTEDAVRVTAIQMQIVSPVYTEAGQWNGELVPTDLVVASSPSPLVELDDVAPGDISLSPHGYATVTVSGQVTDALADIAYNYAGDLTSLTVKANGVPVAQIPLQRDADYETQNKSLIRPYAYRSNFCQQVSFAVREGANSVVVQTSENAAGNTGSDSLLVDAGSKSVVIGEPVSPPDDEPLVYNIALGGPLTDDPDTIQFYFGQRDVQDDDTELTEDPQTPFLFNGELPGIGPIEITISDYSEPTAIEDSFTASVEISLSQDRTWACHGTFTEGGPTSLRFRFITPINVEPAGYATSFAIHIENDLTPATQDNIAFTISQHGDQQFSATLTEIAPADSRIFQGTVPDLGAVEVAVSEYDTTSGELTGTTSIAFEGCGQMTLATFYYGGINQWSGEEPPEIRDFTFDIYIASAEECHFNICLAQELSPNPDTLVFYAGDRAPLPNDPELEEGDSNVFSGDVDGFQEVTVSILSATGLDDTAIDEIEAELTLVFADETSYKTAGTFYETTLTSQRFRLIAVSDCQPLGTSGISRVPILGRTMNLPGKGGGRFNPVLVMLDGPADLLLEQTGRFGHTEHEWTVVEETVGGEQKFFFGGSPAQVFAAFEDVAYGPNLDNALVGTGMQRAWIAQYADMLWRDVWDLDITVMFYHNDQFQQEHDWKDIKLADADPDLADQDDSVYIAGLVKGLEERQLDALPIILYRTIVNDPQDTNDYLLSILTSTGYYGGASLTEPCAEVNMQLKADILLEDPQDRPEGKLFSKVVDLSEYPQLRPDEGDDALKEFAFFDNSPSPDKGPQTQTLPPTGINLNGADCYFMAEHLKTLGWLNRGVSHPTHPHLTCDDDDKEDPGEVRPWARGGKVWGRPVNSVECVAAAGVEKIVASAGFTHLRQPEKTVAVEQGSQWLFPGKTKARDHVLVKSTADLVYLETISKTQFEQSAVPQQCTSQLY